MDDNSALTATNMTVGSLAYAPPEQLTGASLDGRTDQYALAATAFQLLTGKPPFDNSNAAIVISSHLSSPPPRMSDRRPDLAHLDPVIARAMAKEPPTGTRRVVTSRLPCPSSPERRRRSTTRRWWPGPLRTASQPTDAPRRRRSADAVGLCSAAPGGRSRETSGTQTNLARRRGDCRRRARRRRRAGRAAADGVGIRRDGRACAEPRRTYRGAWRAAGRLGATCGGGWAAVDPRTGQRDRRRDLAGVDGHPAR